MSYLTLKLLHKLDFVPDRRVNVARKKENYPAIPNAPTCSPRTLLHNQQLLGLWDKRDMGITMG
jgi:hypothetical protein